MERKIGEIFEYNGEWYQCVGGTCRNCCFYYDAVCKNIDAIGRTVIGNCHCSLRTDHKSVIFKKLEKVGEPFPCRNMSLGRYSIIAQWYKVFIDPILTDDSALSWYNSINETILIALNNKEDMKEGNNTKHSNSENIGTNLKSFDLQAAKSGKPVCTRDGRKARIICFDMNADKPIVALVDYNGRECVVYCNNDGRACLVETTYNDLMMLSEKKEGWVNLYRDEESKRVYCGESIFSEREKAEKHYECNDTKVATVPVNWEE